MEPIYEYIKGKGWILEPNYIGVTLDGKRCRVLVRPPVKGEFYLRRSKQYYENPDGSPEMDRWFSEIKSYRKVDWQPYSGPGFNNDPLNAFVTLIWID